ncbi:MAG: prephenate dehydratase [Sulfolobales archaeon]|nr:prephenate dehydratase [Sulfolobales archaeon]MDW7969671.1 prephenate dehydratase [Sulfolobales archaeon]
MIKPKVSYFGDVGSFSEEASLKFFGDALFIPCKRFRDVFTNVQSGVCDFGVIPVENSLEGSVGEIYDLLREFEVMVYGEIQLRISHCLIALPEVRLGDIRYVYSHPQALAQCSKFLSTLNVDLIPYHSTSSAIKLIKEKALRDSAAIGSLRAAELYGMNVLAREIEDNLNNFTRFLIISMRDHEPTGRDKTSIIFGLPHVPGSLHAALEVFAVRGINLTKIESRPNKERAWEYIFFIDFEGHRLDSNCSEALDLLRKKLPYMKVLGSYPRAT